MPLAIIEAVLGLGGTAMSIAGNAEDQSAMNSTRAQEVAQQQALQKKNTALFQNSLAQSGPATAASQMEAGQAARMSIWNNLQNATTPVASALPAAGVTAPAGSPTSNAATRAQSAADTWNNLNATNAAKEDSYSDWETQQGIKNAATAQKMGVNNQFAQEDANLLPVELQVASQAGSQLSGWGSIVSSLGSLAGLAGATGAFGATAGATTGLGSDGAWDTGVFSAPAAAGAGAVTTGPGFWE